MITNLTLRDFLIHYLNKEYHKRAKILTNLTSHIEMLHKDYILTNIERTRYLKLVNEIVRMLGALYNSRIDALKSSKLKMNNEDIFETEEKIQLDKLTKINKLDTKIHDIVSIPITEENQKSKLKILDIMYDSSELVTYCPNDFDKLDRKLKEVVGNIGCKNINDIICIYCRCVNNIFDTEFGKDNQMLDLLNLKFVPISCITRKKEGDNKIRITHNVPTTEKHEALLGNYYRLEINIPSTEVKQLVIHGFFENDCVNTSLRTSQLTNKYLNDKLELLFKIAETTKKSKVSISFRQSYVKNLSIGDIISYDETTLINSMNLDYAICQRYSSMNFKQMFGEFVHADILTKFKIIKYLLFSPTTTSDSGLLFSLTKESKSGSAIIADLIYKNLNLPLQSKLYKANISIKTEMEKLSNLDSDDIDLKKQIMLNKNIPLKVKKIALEKINEMKSGNSEYYKQLLYVKTLVDFPWVGENDGDIFELHRNDVSKWREIMESTKSKLDSKVYGHGESKETIVELLGKWFSNPKSLGKSIGIEGPPGVGKTMIAQELGKAMGIPFVKISLGSLDDASVLTGHSITYAGATCGLLVKKMIEAGKSRCIIYFDELDKCGLHHGRNEINDVLIHLTDVNTNSEFSDKFFQDVTFPFNKVLFVFSFNERSKIDPILLDRMEIIKADPYSVEDKLSIVNNFLIKEIKDDIGMNLNIKLSEENILYIINNHTCEQGVRRIKSKIEKIFLKLNKDRIFKVGVFEKKDPKTVEITRELIDKYLTKPNILYTKIQDYPMVGIVNGLYVSGDVDGGILPLMVYKNQSGNKKFVLKITGNQKKVMTESIIFAFTIATNLIRQTYMSKFFERYKSGLHVHIADGVSKDGNSAGGAFTLGFISKILDKPIKHDIALTGEINLSGSITAIGGLHMKLIGAKRAGVRLVFIPKENEVDFDKIKEKNKILLDDNFKVIIVQNIKEILEYALIDDDIENKVNITYLKTFNVDKYLLENCNGYEQPEEKNNDSPKLDDSSEDDESSSLGESISDSDSNKSINDGSDSEST